MIELPCLTAVYRGGESQVTRHFAPRNDIENIMQGFCPVNLHDSQNINLNSMGRIWKGKSARSSFSGSPSR